MRHALGTGRVTFAGDRGMIESGQAEELWNFRGSVFTTSPRSPSRRSRHSSKYVLWWNPPRAEQVPSSRANEQTPVARLSEQRNRHLTEYPRARVTTAEKTALG